MGLVAGIRGAVNVTTRRWLLWGALVFLIAGLLTILVWLAARYEASQLQDQLDRDAVDAVSDVRTGLVRNLQALQALQPSGARKPDDWTGDAAVLLRAHRELLRIELRDKSYSIVAAIDSPFRPPVFDRLGRSSPLPDVQVACNNALRTSGASYAASYFVPQRDGLGLEVMDMCLPVSAAGSVTAYLVVTYSLQDILTELVGRQLSRSQDVSFIEADGARLAFHGVARRGTRVYSSRQLLDLPGTKMVLRIDSWRGAPDFFPNLLTAIVTAMTLALVGVLVLLARDTRRRLRAEDGLADALAFRKAMEDSLVTGLRARDLQGRITYVNPAFAQMVGFTAQELQGTGTPAPYWPPELADEYQQRQAIRLAGNAPPRDGFESVFMHKDGSRFPVLIIEAPLINAVGKQTGWMSAFLDIREQRRVEELSRASQDRLQATARLATVGEMASLLSHELNQPLAAISSYATGSMNLLQDGPPAKADLELAMRRIAEQAERAGKVIKSVHDFVRRRDQAREALAPQALLDAIMPLVNLQARKLFVRVVTRLGDDLPTVSCDRTMVEQVLLNLARNAMQAMDQPGIRDKTLVIQVKRAASSERASHTSGWLEFSVADVGPGISAEVANKLFTPFFTTKLEGMGLGLSLCRTVVEQHGGFLGFEANYPQGTVFRFTLPVAG